MLYRSFKYRVSDNGFWNTITHPFVCPSCHGEGDFGCYENEYDPYETCYFCGGSGYVGLLAKLRSLWWVLDYKVHFIKYKRKLRREK